MDVAFGDCADMFYAQAQASSQSAPVRDAGRIGRDVEAGRFAAHHRPVPHTVSASDLQRVISLMLFFNAIPNQPSVKAMLYY